MAYGINRALFLVVILLTASPLLADTRIVVVGATADMRLVERWARSEGAAVTKTPGFQSFRIDKSGISVTALSPTASLSSIANALYQAEVAMLVMDATEGPTPGVREHILVTRQAGVPLIAIMMTNIDELFSLGLDDYRELLDLEVEELRNVLALYEVGGPKTPLFHDSETGSRAPQTSNGKLGDIGNFITYLDPSRDNPPSLESHKNARAQVYFLTDAETNGHEIGTATQQNLKMWCEGSSAIVNVTSSPAFGPGDLGTVHISAPQPFPATEGSRILLLKNGHVVGLGVISPKHM